MFNLLAFLLINFEKILTKLSSLKVIIIVLSIILLIAILLVLPKINKKLKTIELTQCSIAIALSFVLSFIKAKIQANGGSITLFSFVPIILVSYKLGFLKGLFMGLIYGLLQFIEDASLFSELTFLLDYIFAFSSICFASCFKNLIKNKTLSIFLGTTLVYVFRFIFHTISGIFYYSDLEFLPALLSSIIYQLTYIPFDYIICLIFLLPFSKTKFFNSNF